MRPRGSGRGGQDCRWSAKGEEEKGQGGVGPPVLVNEKGSPRRFSMKNPPETNNEDGRGLSSLESPRRGGADLPGQGGAEKDEDQGREVQGGVDKTAGNQWEGKEKKGQGGVGVVVGGGGDQGRTGNIIHEPSNAQKSNIKKNPQKSSLVNCH